MKPITFFSDQASDYSAALTKCKTLPALTELLNDYATIAPDALEAIPRTAEEFDAWRKGLAQERRGVFAGEEFMERFGDMLMPALMFQVVMVAQQFGVPWGLAFVRLKDAGRIVYDDAGRAQWNG
jgi:hypothetical protein